MIKILLLLAAVAALALGGCGTLMTAMTPTSGDPAQGIDTLNQNVEFLHKVNLANEFDFITYQRCAWEKGYITTTKMEPGNSLEHLDPHMLEGCIDLEGFYRDLEAGRGGYCDGQKPTEKYVRFYEDKGLAGMDAVKNAAAQCIFAHQTVEGGGFKSMHYVGDDYSRLCGTAYNPPDNVYHAYPGNDGTIGPRSTNPNSYQPGTIGYAAYQGSLNAKQSCPSSIPDFAGSNSYFIGDWIPMSYVWHYVFTGEWPYDPATAKALALGTAGKSPWTKIPPSTRAHLRSVYAQMLKDHPLN
jgi:hypothetical protein